MAKLNSFKYPACLAKEAMRVMVDRLTEKESEGLKK